MTVRELIRELLETYDLDSDFEIEVETADDYETNVEFEVIDNSFNSKLSLIKISFKNQVLVDVKEYDR